MMRTWFLTSLLILASTFAVASARANDDVFLDEGDGDFDSVPALPKPAKGSAAKPAKNESKSKKAAAAKPAPQKAPASVAAPQAVEVPEPERVEIPPAADEAPVAEAQPADDLPTAEVVGESTHKKVVDDTPAQQNVTEQSAPQEEPKKAAPPKKQAKQAKAPAKKKSAMKLAQGVFVTTKEPCPMTREPASESAQMITVKAQKRIWVEEVDESWVRAFNKAGEPGYISRECVQ
jgi:hypothetical protein